MIHLELLSRLVAWNELERIGACDTAREMYDRIVKLWFYTLLNYRQCQQKHATVANV